MQKRWEVERAVLGSRLEPPARLLVLALLAKAQNKTAVILPEHTPSLTTIQAMTGLARSAIAEWLTALENAGWVTRTKPPKHTRDVRTLYALHVGQATAERPPRPPSKKSSSPPGGTPVVRTTDRLLPDPPQVSSPPRGLLNGASSPPGGTPVVRTTDASSPSGVPATTKSSPTENSSTEVPPLADLLGDSGEAEAAETTQTILANFLDYCKSQGVTIPPRTRGHYAKEIKTALDDKIPPLLVRKALFSMFNDSVVDRPSLLSNRIVHVQTGPERRNGQHRAHQNDPTADYHGGL